jgi:hypothetical protein
MAEDKGPPRGPQLFPAFLKNLKQAPILRQQQEAIARLRERLSRYTPEQLEQLRVAPGTLQFPDGLLPPELARLLREERDWQLEPEQIPEPSEHAPPADQAQTVEPVSAWIEQMLEQVPEQNEQTAEQPEWIEEAPEQQAIEQASPSTEQTTEQASETITGLTPEQIEKELEVPTRPRHRPPVTFPHLQEALTDLKNAPRFKKMEPNEELAFVVKRLQHYGDPVVNAKGQSMDKTISRRIGDWHKGKLKFES